MLQVLIIFLSFHLCVSEQHREPSMSMKSVLTNEAAFVAMDSLVHGYNANLRVNLSSIVPCNLSDPATPIRLDNESFTSFNIEADQDCYVALVSSTYDRETIDYSSVITLRNIAVKLGEGKEPVAIFGGQFINPEAELIVLEEDGDNGWTDEINFRQAIVVFIAPKGSTVSGNASSASGRRTEEHANFQSRGHISSLLYPYSFYTNQAVQTVKVTLPHGVAQFNISLKAFVPYGKFVVTCWRSHHIQPSGYEGVTSASEEISCTASYIQVDYTTMEHGQKGFLLNYVVGEAQQEEPEPSVAPDSSKASDASLTSTTVPDDSGSSVRLSPLSSVLPGFLTFLLAIQASFATYQ